MIMLIIGGIFLLAIFGFIFKFGSLWIQAQLSGAPIGAFNLVGMSLRRVDPSMITLARIMSKKAGLDINSDRLEAHALAGGHVIAVVQALIASSKANITLSFRFARAYSPTVASILSSLRNSSS